MHKNKEFQYIVFCISFDGDSKKQRRSKIFRCISSRTCHCCDSGYKFFIKKSISSRSSTEFNPVFTLLKTFPSAGFCFPSFILIPPIKYFEASDLLKSTFITIALHMKRFCYSTNSLIGIPTQG